VGYQESHALQLSGQSMKLTSQLTSIKCLEAVPLDSNKSTISCCEICVKLSLEMSLFLFHCVGLPKFCQYFVLVGVTVLQKFLSFVHIVLSCYVSDKQNVSYG